jgi:hypothetical protein
MPRVGTARTTAGWWTESVSDGGAHYGVVQPDDLTVRSLCGRAFVPEVNPWTGNAECQQQPADPAHACHACKTRSTGA